MARPILYLLMPLLAAVGSAHESSGCEPNEPCEIAGGTYRYHLPASSRPADPLALLVYIHGYRGSAENVLADATLLAQADRLGFLLVAPDGENGSWGHVGSPARARNPDHRDEIAFFKALIEDVEARFELDPAQRIVLGFSQGGSMVWDIACQASDLFTAHVAVAGAFWEPLGQKCAGPVDLLQVHGLSDGVVPLEGRPIGQDFRQGDVFASMILLREAGACPGSPASFAQTELGVCRLFGPCASDKEILFCVHEGGHEIRSEWIGPIWQWTQLRLQRN